MPQLTRREALKVLTAAGGALALGGCGPFGQRTEQLDVAVVGGGVAGLYLAWSLLDRDPSPGSPLAAIARERPLRVRVFEASDRLGGRLYSVPLPGPTSARGELGAKRYAARHRLTAGLVSHLGLSTTAASPDGDPDLLYLRRRRFTARDLATGARSVPFPIAGRWRRRSPHDLLRAAFHELVPDAQERSPADWVALARSGEARGRPLHAWSAVEWIREVLPPAAAELVLEGVGARWLPPEANALDLARSLAPALAETEWFTPAGGFQQVPIDLASRFVDAGGEVETGALVTSVVPRSVGDGERLRLSVIALGMRKYVEARYVVLALPRRALEALDPHSIPLQSAAFRAGLEAAEPAQGSSLLLAFDRQWWGRLGLRGGRSVTDLPITECRYHATGTANGYVDTSTHRPAAAAFWRDAARSAAFTDTSVPRDAMASEAMVAAARVQLARVHGTRIPEPVWAAYRDWAPLPDGGCWHHWRAGVASVELIPLMRHPMREHAVFVCGEAFSSHQGWVEGALASAERVLGEHLGYERPPWLPSPDALPA
jgi:monoamine oxidase